GHRDADTTTCPGSYAYAKLPTIRTAVRSLIGAGLVAPTISPTSIRMASGQTVAVNSGVLGSQAWKLTVTDAAGTVVRSLAGNATATAPVATTWDGTDDLGVPVPPGTYDVLLSSTTPASTALPYSAKVTVTPPLTVTGPAVVGYGQQVTLNGTAPTGTDVTLQLTRAGVALPAQVIHTTAPTWSATFTADEDYGWTATANGYTTPARSTRVAPTVTSPVAKDNALFIAKGTALRLVGTALPSAGSQVTVTTTSINTGATQATVPATVAANGSWSASLTPSSPVTLAVTDGRGLSTPAPLTTVYPVEPPTATAPSIGYSARSLTVTGNAGHAPVAVQILTKSPGASSYTVATTVTASPTGAYAATIALPAVTSSTPLPWKVTTGYGSAAAGTATVVPAFAPTATAAGSGHYGVAVIYSGKAVPGDRVKLYTRPVGAKTFAWTATATANPTTGAFSLGVALRRDIEWIVQTPSGQTAAKQVLVAPTLNAPSSVRGRTVVNLSGSGVPGWKTAVYQRVHGASRRVLIGTLTVNSTGHWALAHRVDYPSDYWCVANGRVSRAVAVATR
ncbi:MAG: hypothetical protein JO079_00465, partial [Frankiaceae bacterium]|nr:hypothetical protein [Frankiaceae bacterium]MBV9368399.1 hypothetical protein [Frankiales bacterium]